MDWNAASFDIAANLTSVFAASDFYIPFETGHAPLDHALQIQNFKSELRGAIKMMRPQSGEILFAQYAGEGAKGRFFDLENMLFYNIGLSPFASCAAHGISFSILPDQGALCQQNRIKNRKHAYFYQCLPLPSIESHFAALPLMAKWSDVPLNPHEANSPAKYWKALRGARDQISVFECAESPLTTDFALKIELHLPIRIKLVNTVKPLLDGVVCAFHGEDIRSLDCLADFCTRQHCEELCKPNSFPPVLGKREFIRPYRNGRSFLWNPADDFCKLALVTVSYETESPSFCGEIYKFDPNC